MRLENEPASVPFPPSEPARGLRHCQVSLPLFGNGRYVQRSSLTVPPTHGLLRFASGGVPGISHSRKKSRNLKRRFTRAGHIELKNLQKRIQRAVLVSSARTVLFQKTHDPEDGQPSGEAHHGGEASGEGEGEEAPRDKAAGATEARADEAEQRGRQSKKDD